MQQIIIFIFNLFLVNSLYINKYSKIFKNVEVHNKFTEILNNEMKPSLILSGDTTSFKKDFCKNLCDMYNINFREYSFDDFMLKMPHMNYEKSMIYVNDFLIKDGRILNKYEQDRLIELSTKLTSNLIVFQAENIETIPYKDTKIIKKFDVCQFPCIEKKNIVQLIYDIVLINKYHEDLYLINWNSFDIENWNLDKINLILSKTNVIITEKLHNLNNISRIIEKISV
jgi:ribosomal protein S18